MTIDERREALTQTVELLAAMRRDDERKLDERFAEVARLFSETDRFINSLAHIAEDHSERIEKLEDKR